MNNDLISRSELIKWIDDSVSRFGGTYSTDMLNMWGLFKDYLINNAPTVDVMSFTNIICGNCKFVNVARNRKPCCSCKWLERKSYYEGTDDV